MKGRFRGRQRAAAGGEVLQGKTAYDAPEILGPLQKPLSCRGGLMSSSRRIMYGFIDLAEILADQVGRGSLLFCRCGNLVHLQGNGPDLIEYFLPFAG
jgi:hypothetical protein